MPFFSHMTCQYNNSMKPWWQDNLPQGELKLLSLRMAQNHSHKNHESDHVGGSQKTAVIRSFFGFFQISSPQVPKYLKQISRLGSMLRKYILKQPLTYSFLTCHRMLRLILNTILEGTSVLCTYCKLIITQFILMIRQIWLLTFKIVTMYIIF